MGPFSYNMLRNDMLYIIDTDVKLYNYADSKSLVCSGFVYEDVCLQTLVHCFDDNYMRLKTDKFQCIVFGTQTDLGNHGILPEARFKILGPHVYNNLNFDVHISEICKKAGRQVKVLARSSNMLDPTGKI